MPTTAGVVGTVPTGRYVLFAAFVISGVAVDLLTKALFFASPRLRAGDIYWLWTGHVGIQLSWNEGALFGIGQGKTWLFAALSVAAAIAIPVWLFWFRGARDRWLTIALGCVMAGVLGNLYDRLALHGELWPDLHPRAGEKVYAVRDWILWQASDQLRWPNFNIADSLLVVGVATLFLHTLLHSAPAAVENSK